MANVRNKEPDRAIEAYEQALQGATANKKLACKLGHALVRTHQYGSAIKCYRNAGEDGSVELAQLLLRLGQLEIAESTLSHVPLTHKALILAKVREKCGDVPGALATLEEARRMLGRSDAALGYELSRRMAEYATMLHDHDTAIRHHKACLAHRPADSQTQIALAKLYMQVNDWASCQASCSSLLSAEPDNEPALLMLADLAFRRVDFAGAAVHFARLLSRRPTYWIALARLIEVKRRMAQLGDVTAYLDAAGGTKVPGLSYCTGLHLWYSGAERSLPLQQFNQCRGDAEWGQQALHNMVELCMGEPTAARLLQEMRPHTPDEQMSVRLLAAFVRLAAPHEKGDVEAAIAEFTAIAQHDAFRIGSTLGLASSYMAQKQTTRARNVLKRVAQTVWQFEAAEHLERCWLLLAELNVQAGKHDVATELLRRILQHNQSCHRAYSMLGLIAEKEQKYVEASVHYQLAWKMSGGTDPSLGYKLALNLLKGKRHADAISLCHAVLRLSPKYPRIRKDILDKAIAQLRT